MRYNFILTRILITMVLNLLASSQLLRNVKNKEFVGFQLDSQIPSNLILDQVFRIKGVITDPKFYTGNETKKFVLEVNFTKKDNKMVNFSCVDSFDISDLTFDMSCAIKKQGQFIVGLQASPTSISDNKIRQFKPYRFQSKNIRTIKPLNMSSIKLGSKQPPKPEGFQINFVQNLIQLKWTSKAPLTNITFYMTLKDTKKFVKKQFLLSNNHEKFYPDFYEFEFFDVGQTFVEMSHANSQNDYLNGISSMFSKEKANTSFKSMRHFRQIHQKQKYSVSPALPERLKVAERYNFTITFNVKTRTFYHYVSIDYKISRKVKFYRPKAGEEDQVKDGIPVNVQVVFDRPGTYIIGFQSTQRQTIVNHPIYVGEGLPFIPDYFDFYKYFSQNGQQRLLQVQQNFLTKYVTDGKVYKDPGFFASTKQKTTYLFELLNIERKKYKAPPLIMDPTLTKMAQEHCDDMLKNKYIAVKNLKGQTPLDRAIRYNITSLIRQYILPSYSLGGMHLDAQIIASFIEITANKMLTRVGIGIVMNYSEESIPFHTVTYDFTIRDLVLDPPAPEQLAKFRDNVVKVMMEKNPNVLQQNKQLSADINVWIKQGKSTNPEDLEIFLDKKGNYGQDTKVWTREVYFYEQEMQNIRDDQNFDDKEGKKIGLGLGVNKQSKSTLTAYVVFI